MRDPASVVSNPPKSTRYYAAHREEICAAQEEYRKTNREYYWRNRKKMLEYGRKYRVTNKVLDKRTSNIKTAC